MLVINESGKNDPCFGKFGLKSNVLSSGIIISERIANPNLRNNCLAGQGAAQFSSSDYTTGTTVADAAVIELASKAIARLMQVH